MSRYSVLANPSKQRHCSTTKSMQPVFVKLPVGSLILERPFCSLLKLAICFVVVVVFINICTLQLREGDGGEVGHY